MQEETLNMINIKNKVFKFKPTLYVYFFICILYRVGLFVFILKTMTCYLRLSFLKLIVGYL